MSPFRIYNDYEDATIVSNIFIDEYMKDANDAQIKIYLYLIRMISVNKATSIASVADEFNYTEKDIIRALKYWEKNNLLGIEYDEQKNPVGIHLKKISSRDKNANIMKLPAKETANGACADGACADGAFAKDAFAKREYSLDDLKAFKETEETSQLIFVVEKYLGKTLSPSDIKSILFYMDILNFSSDLIDYLIQYCVERGKKDFRYIEKVAISWAEEGITTPKQAARAARKYDKIVYDVMKALGKQANPTKAEADYIIRWVREFGFGPDIIYEACERTVLAVDNHRFEYCNKILSNWKNQDVRTKADILQIDLAHAKKPGSGANLKTSGKVNMFHQFKQNTYDFEALEKEIISN
ncbi:MAG: DnaD domain protein [Lachnospiraceae bacterium]|nr:DnaD domain protein [Lachnospiraceae bacterium]